MELLEALRLLVEVDSLEEVGPEAEVPVFQQQSAWVVYTLHKAGRNWAIEVTQPSQAVSTVALAQPVVPEV